MNIEKLYEKVIYLAHARNAKAGPAWSNKSEFLKITIKVNYNISSDYYLKNCQIFLFSQDILGCDH